MSQFLEFHMIQNFAPSNLNRDDTGAPKDAIFGGYRRARISSQCFKRAVRDFFKTSSLLDATDLGLRTRHLDRVLDEALEEAGLSDTARTRFNEIVKLALKDKDKKLKGEKDEKNDSQIEKPESLLAYLLFISQPEISAMRNLIIAQKDALNALANKKKVKPIDIPEKFKSGIKTCLAQSRAVDIALFGRMLADYPKANQDAACQVAHAISTHRVEREFDYFTAVDDRPDEDETGAGMIGQVEFNSATFYRYAVLNSQKLLANLQGDRKLTLSAIKAFTEALVRAIPSGKQNSFAAYNLPAFIGVCLRRVMPMILANAFEMPIFPSHDKALSEQSVEELAKHETELSRRYGAENDEWIFLGGSGCWSKGVQAKNLDDLAAKAQELADKNLSEAGC
jgi:CRISPR system Cascade subunit CasC